MKNIRNRPNNTKMRAKKAVLPQSLQILERPGIGKKKLQALEGPWIRVAVFENPKMGKIVHL